MMKKPYLLGKIADVLGLTLVQGDPQKALLGVATLETATENDLSFLAHEKYTKYLLTTQAGAVILAPAFVAQLPAGTAGLVGENPKLAFARLLQLLSAAQLAPQGIHPTALCAEGALIDPTASIGPYCVVGASQIQAGVVLGAHCIIGDQCLIGAKTVLKPRVTLYDDVHLGAQCTVHSGAVLGSDGFGFVPSETGAWEKIPQVGGVRIGDRVEIGANTTIDRGAIAHTRIADGVLLDNLIQVAHNVEIGENTAIAACTGISGSTKIGRRCMIGGSAMIAGHLTIADEVHLTGATGVANSIHQKGVYGSAISARPYEQWRRNLARFHHLDELAKRVKKLEKVGQHGT